MVACTYILPVKYSQWLYSLVYRFLFYFIRLQRRRNKRTKRFDAYPVKEAKSYDFIEKVMDISVTARIEKPHLMREKMVLAEADPRRIMPILSVEQPESTQAIYEKKTSRL